MPHAVTGHFVDFLMCRCRPAPVLARRQLLPVTGGVSVRSPSSSWGGRLVVGDYLRGLADIKGAAVWTSEYL